MVKVVELFVCHRGKYHCCSKFTIPVTVEYQLPGYSACACMWTSQHRVHHLPSVTAADHILPLPMGKNQFV